MAGENGETSEIEDQKTTLEITPGVVDIGETADWWLTRMYPYFSTAFYLHRLLCLVCMNETSWK